MLLHGATQIMDRGLFTNADNMEQLDQLVEFSECPSTRCAPRTVANFITRTLKLQPDPGISEVAEHYTGGGINPTPVPQVSCAELMTVSKGTEWHTVPSSVSVKSHYPAATPQESVKNWTEHVSKVVHTVRNPFDNIASRFLGNKKAQGQEFVKRFKALENARKRNQTTPEFVKFVAAEIRDYVTFHEYWLGRRTADAARGISTLYTRYESMCQNTREVVTAITKFGGWKMQGASFRCILDSQPCSVSGADFPQHIQLFNDKQIDTIIAKTAHLLVLFGYQFDLTTNTIRLVSPQIPMCNGA